MNRRAFLVNPLILTTPSMKTKTETKTKPYVKPVGSLNAKDNKYTMFKSENEKFVSQIVYEDLGECVRMYTIIDWQDPITQEPIERKNVELFILDQGGEM